LGVHFGLTQSLPDSNFTKRRLPPDWTIRNLEVIARKTSTLSV
jgi:hypothetical protein